MAIIAFNSLVTGCSGSMGNLIFKNVKGRVVMSQRPKPTTKESTQQRSNRDRFREATTYAKTMMLIPEKKAYYQRKAKKLNLTSAYTAAITDYMRKPQVLDAVAKNQTISITTYKKNFPVKAVRVRGINTAGVIMHEGEADLRNHEWLYKIPETVHNIRFIIIVRDEPGNTIEHEHQLLL